VAVTRKSRYRAGTIDPRGEPDVRISLAPRLSTAIIIIIIIGIQRPGVTSVAVTAGEINTRVDANPGCLRGAKNNH